MDQRGKPKHLSRRRGVALALTGALAVAACGEVRAGDAPTEDAGSTQTVARAESRLLDLYTQVSGSVEDRRAQEFVAYAALQGYFDSCMAARGFTYNAPAFYDIYAGQTSLPLPDTYPELAAASPEDAATQGLGIGERVAAAQQSAIDPAARAGQEERTAAYNRLSASQQAAYAERLAECEQSLPPGLESKGVPAAKEALSERLTDAWRTAVEAPDVRAASARYARCMGDQDVPVKSREALLIKVDSNYGPFKADLDDTAPLDLADPQFAAAQEFERQAAVADARCRQEAHQLAMQRLLPLLDTFEAEQREQVVIVREQWAQTRAEASRLRTTAPW